MKLLLDTNLRIPEGWTITALETICDITAGNPAPQGEEFFEGGIFPFVRVQDMGRLGEKTYLTETKDSINNKAISKLKLFPKGSVLFTKSGASTLNNQRAILGQDSYVVSHIAAAIPGNGVSNKWIYFCLKCVDFADLAHSSVMPSLPLAKVKPIQVLLPPTNEQHRIVAKIEALFSELDNGIESLKTAREQLKIYRQALLKHAFSGKLTEQWRAENQDKLETAEALLQRIQTEREQHYQQQLKDWEATGKQGSKPKAPKTLPQLTAEELAELPVGWGWISVAQLLAEELCNGKSVKDRVGGFPVLRLNALVDGKVDLSISKAGDWTDIQAKNYVVKNDDFLVSRGNGSKHLVGRGGFVRFQIDQTNAVAFPDTMIRVRLQKSLVSLPYFAYCWTKPLSRRKKTA